MKIYMAATFSEQHRMRKMRDELFKRGHIVVSTWLNEIIKPEHQNVGQFGRKMAMKDLQEISEADCFILDRLVPSMSGGKMVEYGFALRSHKLLYVVDPDAHNPGSIFLRLADHCFAGWEDLLVWFDENHKSDKVVEAV